MISRRGALAAIAVVAVACAGGAPAQQAAGLSPGDDALAQRAAAYLDALTTATGRFVQTSAATTGTRAATARDKLYPKCPFSAVVRGAAGAAQCIHAGLGRARSSAGISR